MTTATITYMRFDGTDISIPPSSTQNYFLSIFHVNGTTLNGSETLPTLIAFTNNNSNVRQKISTTTITNKTINEWDNLTTQITGMDSHSALIVFVIQKIQSGTNPNNYVDYYNITNLQSKLQTNPNLVYNTDNYYLLEMTSAINTFDRLRPKPTKSPSGVSISSNAIVQNEYNGYYSLLSNQINSTAQNQNETVQQVLNNIPLANSIEQQTMGVFNNFNRPSFYTKYVADRPYSNVDVISKMQQNIYTTKCVLPFSSVTRTTQDESAVRFTMHYTI